MNKRIWLGAVVVAALVGGSSLYAQQAKTYFIDPSVPGWPVGRITGPSKIHCRACNTYVVTAPPLVGAFDPSRYWVSDKPNVQAPAVHWVPTVAPVITISNFAELQRREFIRGRQNTDAAYNVKMQSLQAQQFMEDYEAWQKEYNKPENVINRNTEAMNNLVNELKRLR